MGARIFSLILVAGIAATTAGAAPPLASNGLLAFARMRGDNTLDPRIYVISARGSPRRQVSRHTAFGAPEWSPDGSRIAYPAEGRVVITSVDGRHPDREFVVPGYADDCCNLDWSPSGKQIAVTAVSLYVKTLGGRLKRLTRDSASDPAWSPDGKLIAYRNEGWSRLFVIGANGHGRRRLATKIGALDAPSWSPSGRKLVVGLDGDIYVVDSRTRSKRRIVRRHWSKDPLWAPSGRWIAFAQARSRTKPADVYVIRPDGTGLKRLTRTPSDEGSLTWSPSGLRLAYSGRRADVFVVDLLHRGQIRISRRKCGEGADLLTWSPSADRVAFRSTPVRSDAEIVIADASGHVIRPLTDDCSVWEQSPAWSPRGHEIAYDRYRGRKRHIYLAADDGSRVRPVTSNPGGGLDPSWSPDGEQLVFSRHLDDYDTELFVIRRNGRSERQLTATAGSNYAPAWSHIHGRIAFTSSRDGSAQIYVMNADGSGLVRLTGAGGSEPAWSPDALRIAFIHAYNVWTMKADGTDAIRLTTRDGYTAAQSPAWSPDGTQIAFSVDVDYGRGSQYALYVVDAATGAPRMVIFDNQDNLDPDWQLIP